MAETSNIARFAEEVKDRIFSEFGWERLPSVNQNWLSNKGDKMTTDCVFRYWDPYRARYMYYNTDLKSYKKTSITKPSIAEAIRSLAKTVPCTYSSSEWRELYLDDTCTDVTPEAFHGLLFVYNYDQSFDGVFNTLIPRNVILESPHRVYCLSPQEIRWLIAVAFDLKVRRGEPELSQHDFDFFCPDKVLVRLDKSHNPVATIEHLKSRWIGCRYRKDKQCRFVFYYRNPSAEVNELVAFIESLFHYQVVASADDIEIRFFSTDNGGGQSSLEKAKRVFLEEFTTGNMEGRLRGIKSRNIPMICQTIDLTEEVR